MPQRLLFLDGLRGWAAIIVVLLHIFLQILPPIDVSRLHLQLWWPFTGSFAVALFFLVSGYSLSIGFLNKGDKRLVMRTAVGRYLRLFIPIFFACALTSVFLNTGLIPAPADRTPDMAKYFSFSPTFEHLVKFTLFDVFFNYSQSESYAPPLWTMSYEFLGSMLIAALLLILGKPSENRLMFLAVGLTLFVYQPWYSLFVIGIISIEAREWLAEHTPGWTGVLLMISGAVLSVVSKTETHLLVVASTLFFIGAMHTPIAIAFFSNRFSKALGEISFSIYLVHVPVTFASGMLIYVEFVDSNLIRFGAGCVALVASVLVSVVFIPINTLAIQASRWIGRFLIRDRSASEGSFNSPRDADLQCVTSVLETNKREPVKSSKKL